jgi:hypothetical protein
VPRNRYNRIVYFNEGKVHLRDYLGDGQQSVRTSNNGKPGEAVDAIAGKILVALEKSHHFFPDLLALFPKADYRTIATAVGKLHQEGKIMQDDKEGKYQLRGQADP